MMSVSNLVPLLFLLNYINDLPRCLDSSVYQLYLLVILTLLSVHGVTATEIQDKLEIELSVNKLHIHGF